MDVKASDSSQKSFDLWQVHNEPNFLRKRCAAHRPSLYSSSLWRSCAAPATERQEGALYDRNWRARPQGPVKGNRKWTGAPRYVQLKLFYFQKTLPRVRSFLWQIHSNLWLTTPESGTQVLGASKTKHKCRKSLGVLQHKRGNFFRWEGLDSRRFQIQNETRWSLRASYRKKLRLSGRSSFKTVSHGLGPKKWYCCTSKH